MSSPLRIQSLGRFAQAALAAGDAKIIAVFERSAYVETAAGLACIGSVGNGPLNALVDPLPGLAVGVSVRLDYSGAAVWQPRRPPPWDARVVAASLAQLKESARDRLPTEGFGYLLGPAGVRLQPVQALIDWIAKPEDFPHGAAGLIGLGPGLTPSGDDLVGGALCALHAAGRKDTAVSLGDWALRIARGATSRISYAHLACAAQGECAEPVNEAIVALLAGDPPDLGRIDRIGHTSGWDALAGVTLALHAVLRSAERVT